MKRLMMCVMVVCAMLGFGLTPAHSLSATPAHSLSATPASFYGAYIKYGPECLTALGAGRGAHLTVRGCGLGNSYPNLHQLWDYPAAGGTSQIRLTYSHDNTAEDECIRHAPASSIANPVYLWPCSAPDNTSYQLWKMHPTAGPAGGYYQGIIGQPSPAQLRLAYIDDMVYGRVPGTSDQDSYWNFRS